MNPWIQHIKSVRASHRGLSYKEAMKMAKKTYKKVGVKPTVTKKVHKRRTKSKSKKHRKSKSRRSKSKSRRR